MLTFKMHPDNTPLYLNPRDVSVVHKTTWVTNGVETHLTNVLLSNGKEYTLTEDAAEVARRITEAEVA